MRSGTREKRQQSMKDMQWSNALRNRARKVKTSGMVGIVLHKTNTLVGICTIQQLGRIAHDLHKKAGFNIDIVRIWPIYERGQARDWPMKYLTAWYPKHRRDGGVGRHQSVEEDPRTPWTRVPCLTTYREGYPPPQFDDGRTDPLDNSPVRLHTLEEIV